MLLKKIWVLVLSFMYLASVDPMDISYVVNTANWDLFMFCSLFLMVNLCVTNLQQQCPLFTIWPPQCAIHSVIITKPFIVCLSSIDAPTSRKAFGGCELGFPMGRDSTTFRDSGTEVSSLSRDKGTSSKSGTGRDSQNPGRDGGQNGTEQKKMF